MPPRDPKNEDLPMDPMRKDPHPPEKPPVRDEIPPAGPHAEEDLIDEDRTPGSGALPEKTPTGAVDAGTG